MKVAITVIAATLIGCIENHQPMAEDMGPPCTLPSVGDPCLMPQTEAQARAIILSEAPCPVMEVRENEFICDGVPVGLGGFDLPDWFDRPLPDYSIYRCEVGVVESVWRAVILDNGVFHVRQRVCEESDCQFFSDRPCR